MSQNKKRRPGSPEESETRKKIQGRKAEPNMAFRKETSRKKALKKEKPQEEKPEETKPEEKKSVQYEDQLGFRIGGRIVLGAVFLILTVGMIYLLYKQYDIQITHYEEYSMLASDKHWKRNEDVPTRGDILDCNGNILASTTYEYTIGMTPSDVLKSQKTRKNGLTAEQIASAFAEIVGADHDKMLEWLADTEAKYIQVIKKVSLEQKKELSAYISENSIGGIKIDTVPKRYYTYDNLAAQVIGFADQRDNTLVGQSGIEGYYDEELTGTKGYIYAEVDNYYQSALPYSAPTSIEAVDGYNVQLSLDMNIQRIAEEACRDAYEQYAPREGVTCIVMDPFTGEIKAMVSIPDYNLNAVREKPDSVSDEKWNSMDSNKRAEFLMSSIWRNRCISDTYEPGSTMKSLTTAMALELNLTYEDEVFSDSPIKITSVDTISCWSEKDGNHGEETLRLAFERSCNPIFVQLAQRIKLDRYYDYIRNCGFYDVTGVDLPGESKGIFHAHPTEVDLATLSFGESSTVTPLQLITAYSALVNGGSLIRPRVASRLVDADGNIIREYSTEKIRTVFSEDTTRRVRSLLEDVVKEGTGAAGYVPGYYVAGKTSTSTIETGDEAGLHVLSFCCHAPSYDPQIAVLVIINKPEDKELSSSAAAKVAARVVEGTLDYMGIQRRLSEKEYKNLTVLHEVPDVIGKKYSEAKKILMDEGFEVVDGFGTMTADTIVGTEYYGGVEAVAKKSQIILYPGEVSESDMTTTVIPNFEGMSLIESQRMASQYGLNIIVDDEKANLEGNVVSQSPKTTIGEEETTPTPTPSPDGESGSTEETGDTTSETGETAEEGGITESTTNAPEETSSGETEGTEPGESSSGETNEGGENSETTETTAPPPKRVPYGTVIYLNLK